MKIIKKISILIFCLLFIYCSKNDAKPAEKPVVKAKVQAKDSTVMKVNKKETNAAQSYMDSQTANIQKAKDAMDKSNKATQDQLDQLK